MSAHLTAKDVAGKQFTNIGLFRAHGYDETEVDDYLDQVEDQLVEYERLIAETVGMCRRIAAGTHKDFPRNAKPARVARAVLQLLDKRPALDLAPLPADYVDVDPAMQSGGVPS